jgi:hypothetical protein
MVKSVEDESYKKSRNRLLGHRGEKYKYINNQIRIEWANE